MEGLVHPSLLSGHPQADDAVGKLEISSSCVKIMVFPFTVNLTQHVQGFH